MSNYELVKDDLNDEKVIDAIGRKYTHLDVQYAGVTNFPANLSISADGLSLLDDIEFFLSQPDLNTEMEEELFKILQVYALKYLRTRRSQAGGKHD